MGCTTYVSSAAAHAIGATNTTLTHHVGTCDTVQEDLIKVLAVAYLKDRNPKVTVNVN
jgi:hypothetical protein